MVLRGVYCERCGDECDDYVCRICQINNLKQELTNWNSGNEKMDSFIKEMKLKTDYYNNIEAPIEWVPYNQFTNIKTIGKNGIITTYIAKWKDGPVQYDDNKKEWKREANITVTLKCFYNSQDITD